MQPRERQKAVIYCRVSSVKQRLEGHGLESQETRCRQYAQGRGYDVIDVFKDEFSGAAAKRPAMLAMLKFLRASRRDQHVVIIDDISRLARSVEAHIQLRSAITLAGGILESPGVEFKDDPDSELQEFILATVAQHQRRKNAQQVKNRMMARTMNGYWCFQAPVGYRFEKVRGHGKLLVRHEPYASIIQEALEGYAAGRFQTQIEVERFLAAHPEWDSTRRRCPSNQGAYDMLRRPIYAGYLEVAEWGISLQPGKHEPIISFETFRKIQDRLNGVAKVPARQHISEHFVLRNFIVCGCCNAPLQGVFTKGRSKYYPYYICTTKGCSQYGKSNPRDKVEREFETLLHSLRPTQALFALAREVFQDIWNLRLQGTARGRAAVEAELTKLERNVAQLLERVVEADADALVKAYEGRIRALEARKIELREKLASMGKVRREFDATFRTAMDFLKNPLYVWALGELTYRRLVLKLAFAERIGYVRGEGFRTAKTSMPFKALEVIKGGLERMVDATGIEPVTPSV